MRILHTSDWHLGRTLHGENLHPHQEHLHDWLVDLVTEREVNVVVIPGDVYDRAVPPIEAVRLLSSTLARLAEVATVVLTPGNHDSSTRLGFGSALMRDGVHILADTPGLDHPVSVTDEHGEVLFFGLPYLEPDLARFDLALEESEPLARSHEAVTRAALDRVRRRIGERAEASADTARPRSVVLAHTFVAGGDGSESERDLSVGGVDSVPAPVLGGFDYVALGHLHGCQDLSASVGSPAWYSGSPLAFSFSEKDHRKSVLLIDLGAPEAGVEAAADGVDASAADGVETAGADLTVERISTPVPRVMTELHGTLQEVLARADEHGEDWLKAVITDSARPPQLIERLRAVYPHLRHTEHRPEGRETHVAAPTVAREADPMEVMGEFLAYVTGAEATADERQVFEQAYGTVRTRRQEAS